MASQSTNITMSDDGQRVLFLTRHYPNPDNPLETPFIREHARAANTQNEVTVLRIEQTYVPDRERWWVRILNDPELMASVPTYEMFYQPYTFFPSWSREKMLGWINLAVKQIESERDEFDLVHGHVYDVASETVSLAKHLDVPAVMTEQFSMIPRGLLEKSQKKQLRKAYQQVDFILPVSGALKQALEDLDVPGPYNVIPNTVDTSRFYPPENYSFEPPLRMLFVGRLERTHVKGIPDLLGALSQLETDVDWELILIGDGMARDQYEQRASKEGLRQHIQFKGNKPPNEVAEQMRAADCFVLPSRWDNCPTVLVEAFASGLPVLATNTGGIPELFFKQGGELVEPRSPSELSDGIRHMLNSIKNFDRREIARKAESQFNLDNIGSKFNSIYQDVLSDSE